MSNPSKIANDAAALLSGRLVVGNHDTVTLLGVRAQNELGDHARRITTMLSREADTLDEAVASVLANMKRAQGSADGACATVGGTDAVAAAKSAAGGVKSLFAGLLGRKKEPEQASSPEDLSDYLAKSTAQFKLQQARLIKETKILEMLECAILKCVGELEECINEGSRVLDERAAREAATNATRFLTLSGDLDDSFWYERLEKRVADLATSRTVALQTRAQVAVLRKNNLLLLDRVASVISNLSTICQGQMAVEQGIDLLETRLKAQELVMESMNEGEGAR